MQLFLRKKNSVFKKIYLNTSKTFIFFDKIHFFFNPTLIECNEWIGVVMVRWGNGNWDCVGLIWEYERETIVAMATKVLYTLCIHNKNQIESSRIKCILSYFMYYVSTYLRKTVTDIQVKKLIFNKRMKNVYYLFETKIHVSLNKIRL